MNRPKWLILGLAGVLALAAIAVAAFATGKIGRNAPDQPIAFPHDLHAGGANKIPCMYCHYSADRSVDAGMPAIQVRAERPGVKQLVAYWQNKQSIPWVRIYDLPDHVHFPHMRHIKAGLDCQQCHGAVQTMAK